MKFQEIIPHQLLQKYIDKIFVLECEGKRPEQDLKLIVPNGRVKLVVPFKNSIVAEFNGSRHYSKENKITLIGFTDLPSVVDMASDETSGNITVEFSPLGAYRFLNISFGKIKNMICAFEDVIGYPCLELEEKLTNAITIEAKLNLLQDFLASVFVNREEDMIFEYCVDRIISDGGKTRITDLERSTGYSSRWINAKFNERIGTSAKNLGAIIKFQQYYRMVSSNREKFFFEKHFYDYYYDQSHFIKDFKRFTGYPPGQLSLSNNDYDKVFYKD